MSYSSFWSYCLFSFSSVSYHGLCWSLSLRTSRNWLPTSILLRGCSMELQLPLYFGLDLDSLISRDLIKWVHIIKTIAFLSTDLETFWNVYQYSIFYWFSLQLIKMNDNYGFAFFTISVMSLLWRFRMLFLFHVQSE